MGIANTSGLFKPKSHDADWLAVGIAAQGIHVAQVNLDGAMPRVLRCEYHAGEVTAAALEKACRGAGKHDCTTLLAPGEYQMLMVDAPNVPAGELKTAIRWKIKDSLNYHIDDATVDVLQIPASKYGADRAQSMYAIAASNSTIQQRIELFEQAKIKLDVIDVPEMAQRNIAALFEQEGRALVVLTFDDDGGLLTITAGGELYMSRRLEISAGQLQDANESLRQQYRGRIELELQRSLDYFDRQYNNLPVSRVLVSVPKNNTLQGESDLVSALASAVDVKTESLDIAQVMDISLVPALADSEFAAHTLMVLGGALRKETKTL